MKVKSKKIKKLDKKLGGSDQGVSEVNFLDFMLGRGHPEVKRGEELVVNEIKQDKNSE